MLFVLSWSRRGESRWSQRIAISRKYFYRRFRKYTGDVAAFLFVLLAADFEVVAGSRRVLFRQPLVPWHLAPRIASLPLSFDAVHAYVRYKGSSLSVKSIPCGLGGEIHTNMSCHNSFSPYGGGLSIHKMTSHVGA